MNKKLLLSSTVLLVGLLFLTSALSLEDLTSAVSANNQFAFELYSRYKSKDENIFFSPYSISTALAMAYEGARGKTADEIQSVFHFPKDDYIRRESFLNINNQINKKNNKYQLRIANALWAQKDYPFLNDFFNLIKNYYGGKAANLDFMNDNEKSRITINDWIEEQTNNKIKDLIPSLDSLVRLVITNAIYFKGKWIRQFDKKDTQERDFRVSPGNTVKIQMMNKKARFNYAETEKLQILELPYDGEELSMLILLPKEDDLKSIEESLGIEKLPEWRKRLEEIKVDVYLPKFSFKTKYFMAKDLEGMGMPTAFTLGVDFSGKADFSGMTGKKDLNINEVIHQAFVEVNEEGTEAAAATAVQMGTGSAMSYSVKFNADHPFIFIIQEKQAGNILFLGRVSNPISKS